MSALLCIASDYPLPEVFNPHEKNLSVNEALAMGIKVPQHLFAPGIDRDWKNAVYWSDRSIHFDLDHGTVEDGGFDDDFSILPLPPGLSREDIYTTKKYQSAIECIWTEGRAKAIIEFLRIHLEVADEMELWRIYMGSGEQPKILRYEAQIDTFTPEDLIEIADLPVYEKEPIHHCVTITK